MEWLESLGLLGLFLGSALAASIVPFSSDVLYVAILATTGQDLGCFLAATSGSWLGSLFTFYLGWLGKWEWIQKWFKVTREKLEQQQVKVKKYGPSSVHRKGDQVSFLECCGGTVLNLLPFQMMNMPLSYALVLLVRHRLQPFIR